MHQRPNSQQGFIISLILLIAFIVAMIALAMYAMTLNSIIVNKFENRKWDIPATLYSKPLTITPDSPLSPAQLDEWLRLLGYQKGNLHQTGTYQKNNQSYTIHTRGFDYGNGEKDDNQVIQISFADGKITSLRTTKPNGQGMLRLEPINIGGIYPANNEDRQLIDKTQIPQQLTDALIATEDRAFYEHHGVSLRGIGRALLANISGKSMQGGSTITQQLIKNFYLNSERTFSRKANEVMMALLLEMHYTKEEILLAYLNEINLGQNGNRSVNGFGIAAQFYFNKPLNELSLEQHALLVGIAKGPSYYNPRKHPERALQRRNTVLHNMLITGKISQAAYDTAITKPLSVVKVPSIAKFPFPDFLDMVQRELKLYYKDEDLQTRGLRIISTLDPIAQRAAEQSIKKQLTALRQQNAATKPLQAALISANPKTGELLALIGGGDDFTGFNRAIDAKRQVGSLLKPAIYLTALQSGRYQLTSTVSDESITYQIGQNTWTPQNYGGRSHGNVPLIDALANSYNQAAVNVGLEFGMEAFINQLGTLGITSQIPQYPATMLGAVNLSPLQMLGMYQIFANGGAYAPIHSVTRVIDEQGNIAQRNQNPQGFRASPQAVYLLNRALQEVMLSGTAKGAGFDGTLGLAGKTGTTNDYKDAWFAGYSDNYVSIVWIGRDDNKPIGLTGGTGALPIWADYMRRLSLSPVNLPIPQGITWQWVNRYSGQLSHQDCPNASWLPIMGEAEQLGIDECASMIIQQSISYLPAEPADEWGNDGRWHETQSLDEEQYPTLDDEPSMPDVQAEPPVIQWQEDTQSTY